MNNLTKGLILIGVILAIGVGLVMWKNKVGGQSSESFNSISRQEIEMLLADAAKTNPMILKRLAEDPETKKQQIENLKQLLAFASQAQKEGLASESPNKQELDNIKSEIIAVNYDHEINKDKGPMPPFGFITDDAVKAYWGEDSQPAEKGWFAGLMEKVGLGGTAEARTHDAEFNDFLNTKIEILKQGNPEMKDREISDEEKTQARDIFAKIRIYRHEFEQKARSGELSKEFIDKTYLQVKLQEAQFLAKLYSDKIADKTKATDDDVAKYIADHPELSPTEKRAKAQDILNRAKNGEDFAALANQYSEDPGNKDQKTGEPKGGLYPDTPKGRMMPAFEQAALALEQGQVAPDLVETDYGFHIVKLERKLGPGSNKDQKTGNGNGAATGDTYDVRHILISTQYKDPDKPTAREMPIKEYVKSKLEDDKEKKLLSEIVAANNIQVPEDFTVPEVTDEQIQQMKQKQQMQQMPQGSQPDSPGGKPAPVAPKKPDAKKQ